METTFEIREIRRQGPYYIGAGRNDITVAFEIATRLAVAGEKVAVLLAASPCGDKPARRGWFSRGRRRSRAGNPRAVPGMEVIEVAAAPGDKAGIALLVAACLKETQLQHERGLLDDRP